MTWFETSAKREMAVSKCGLQVGDLVEFDKIVYEHWAVYVGDNILCTIRKLVK